TAVKPFPIKADRPYLFVKVETDEGVYGIGEAGITWREWAVGGAIRHLQSLLVGQDPFRTEFLWQQMHRGAFFPAEKILCSAMSAIDIALWDIKGKALNQPVYNLIGGLTRDRVVCYPHTTGRTLDELLDSCRQAVKESLRLRQHGKKELAHYARECYDIDYLFPMGWAELEGIANRGDFDLVQHAKYSGKSLNYLDEETKEHIIPYIIEPSAGVDRSALAFLCDTYDEEPDKEEIRVLLHLHPTLAPIKVAVLPLSRREKLVAVAKKIYADLRPNWMIQYDDAQSIGRRYRRQDEIGTPLCVTVDFQSLED
ncbi:unnamed protein product, partial [marine sediment metagenome]